MSDIAVRVEDLGKQYHIGQRAHYRTVRESFSRLVGAPFAKLSGRPRSTVASNHYLTNTFWALRNVSFELKQGELLGIIGRNGAGKSTLLKILSQITEPTEGTADVRGRVRSLLEVGTGFHPELTGRENVYLNGAILGMRRAEITRKFDEIVAFAEIEKFIDTPVKWYSTGMYTRLAFSVAAHLEPDILIVDEVLAVGDIRFQQRCLAKMHEVSDTGRTVFFVSHQLPNIAKLCERVLLIDGGRVVADGPADEVVSQYMQLVVGTTGARTWSASGDAPGTGAVRLRSVRVRLEDGQVTDAVDTSSPVAVEMQFEILEPGLLLAPSFLFYNRQGTCLFVSNSPKHWARACAVGTYTDTCWIPGNLLAEGTVMATAVIASNNPHVVHIHERNAVAFEVTDNAAMRRRPGHTAQYPGLVRPLLEWTTDMVPALEDVAVHA